MKNMRETYLFLMGEDGVSENKKARCKSETPH